MIKTDSDDLFHHVQSGLDLEPITLNLSDPELSNARKLTYGPNSSTPLPGEGQDAESSSEASMLFSATHVLPRW